MLLNAFSNSFSPVLLSVTMLYFHWLLLNKHVFPLFGKVRWYQTHSVNSLTWNSWFFCFSLPSTGMISPITIQILMIIKLPMKFLWLMHLVQNKKKHFLSKNMPLLVISLKDFIFYYRGAYIFIFILFTIARKFSKI